MNGYLLLHGKGSGPTLDICSMNPVAKRLEEDKKLYLHQTYSWGLGKVFQEQFENCLDDVANGIKELESQGATKIHLVGHSLGANVAFFYATQFSNFESIVALAAAHNTHLAKFNQWSSWSRNKAHALVNQGLDLPADFIDMSMMEVYIISAIPSAYLSYLDPNGKTVMTKNVRRFKTPANLFIASGTKDMTQVEVETLLYNPAQKTTNSVFLQTNDDHLTLPINTYLNWTSWCESLSLS
jgi:pimeloyl-ACP methyl ester carboxylesterase